MSLFRLPLMVMVLGYLLLEDMNVHQQNHIWLHTTNCWPMLQLFPYTEASIRYTVQLLFLVSFAWRFSYFDQMTDNGVFLLVTFFIIEEGPGLSLTSSLNLL